MYQPIFIHSVLIQNPMKRLSFLFAPIFFMFLGLSLSAQPKHHGQHGPKISSEDRAALHSEIRSYLEAEVQPVLSVERAKADRLLSADEQAQLTKLRSDLKDLRDRSQAQRKALREQHTPGERPSEEMREQMQDAHRAFAKEKRQLMTQVWAIADAHDRELESILDELKPQAKEWRQEIKAIMEKYRPEADDMEAKPGRPSHERHHERGGHRHGPEGLGKVLNPAGFLLWDGELPMEPETPESQMRVFPNPASGPSSVGLNLAEGGLLKLELLNKEGQVLKQVYAGQVESGKMKIDLSSEALDTGVYLVRMSLNKEVITRKLIVE